MDNLAVFGCGFLGGVAVELLNWYRIREVKKRPHFSKSAAYWVPTVGMALMGGGFPLLYCYSGIDLTPFLAVHLGASTPILIGNLAKAPPKIAGES